MRYPLSLVRHDRLVRPAVLMASLLSAISGPAFALPCTYNTGSAYDAYWTGCGLTFNWSNALNWDTASVPTKSASTNVLMFSPFDIPTESTLNENWTLGWMDINGSNISLNVSNGARLYLHSGIRFFNTLEPVFGVIEADIHAPIQLQEHAEITLYSSADRLRLHGGINTNGNQLTLTSEQGSILVQSAITGAGSLVKNGAGTATLFEHNSYAGNTLVSEGTLRLYDNGYLPDTTQVTLLEGATLRLDPVTSGGRRDAIAGLYGAGHVELIGGSILYSGNSNNALGNGGFSGSMSGSGGFGKRGSGIQYLTGQLDFTGPLLVEEGTLVLAGAAHLSGAPATAVTAGATLDLRTTVSVGALTGSGTIRVAVDEQLITRSGEFGGEITGMGGLTKQGNDDLVLTSRQRYTGATRVDAGSLILRGSGRLADTTDVHLNGFGLLNLDIGMADAINGLYGDGLLVIDRDSSLVIGNYAGYGAEGSGNFSGVIHGLGTLVKRGPGTQVLYSDGGQHTLQKTLIESGELQIASASVPTERPGFRGLGEVSIVTGGQLTGNGYVTYFNVDIQDGRLAPGTETSIGQLSMSILRVGDAGSLSFDIGGSLTGEYDRLLLYNDAVLGGTLETNLFDGVSLNPGDSFDLITAESLTGQFNSLALVALGHGMGWELNYLYDDFGSDILRLSVVSTVPVPAAAWLFSTGLIGLVAVARRRQRSEL